MTNCLILDQLLNQSLQMTSQYMEALPTALQYLQLGCSRNFFCVVFQSAQSYEVQYCLIISSFINCNSSSIHSAVYVLLCAVHFSTILLYRTALKITQKVFCMKNYWSCRHTLLMCDVQIPIFSQHKNESYANNTMT